MIGYIAKDRNGESYLHTEKPEYDTIFEVWLSDSEMVPITGEFPEFDNISYKDEPIKVEIKLEKV